MFEPNAPILKTRPFELHQGGTPQGFVVRTVGLRINYFSIRFDGSVIANSEGAYALRKMAPHIFRAVETYLQQAAEVLPSVSKNNDRHAA